jgi:hypothetical protein
MTEARSPNIWNRFLQHLIEWNVFSSEDEQSTIDDDQFRQNTTNSNSQLLQEQRIATRVYIITLTS